MSSAKRTAGSVASDLATARKLSSAEQDEIQSLRSRFEHAKYGDIMKNTLMEDVISRYEDLLRTHNEYVTAHQQERETAQAQLQRQAQLYHDIGHLQGLLNRDPFVLLLIDGNGMVFNSAFLKAGRNGGEHAAAVLHNYVIQWTENNVIECPCDIKVVVHVYADIKSLAEVCFRAGLVDAESRLLNFTYGFSHGKPLFDFIDTGNGSEVAASKITESLKLFVNDYHCRQILLGCSHEDSYAQVFQQYASEEVTKTRLTLLEGVPFGKDLTSLPFQHAKFPGVFHESRIVNGIDLLASHHGRFDSRNNATARTGDFPSSGTGLPTPRDSPSHAKLTPSSGFLIRGVPRSNSLASSGATSENDASLWSTVTARNAHRPLTSSMNKLLPESGPASASSTSKDPTIIRNKAGQRLDKPLDYDRAEVQRLKKLKACNQHFIGIGCCHYDANRPDKCPHNHGYKFSPAELKNLKVVARETPCKRGHGCEDVKCIYGHTCPFPVPSEGSMRGAGGCLNGEACRFPRSMHNMDNVAVRTTKVTGLS